MHFHLVLAGLVKGRHHIQNLIVLPHWLSAASRQAQASIEHRASSRLELHMTPCWDAAPDVPETVQTEDVLAAQVLMTLAVPGAGPRAMTTTTTASGMAAWAVAAESAGAAAARRSLRRAHVGDALRRCAAAVEPVTVAEQGQTFTPLHDAWLLRAAERLGAAASQRAAIKRASMSDGAFLFDHYFRSRTAEQLGERVDKLVEVAKRSRCIGQLAPAPAPLSQRRITAAWTAKKPRTTARVHELTQAEVGKLDAVLRERQAARDAEIERLTAQAAGLPRQSPGRARVHGSVVLGRGHSQVPDVSSAEFLQP
jgi:hypothetical protein